MSLTKMLDSRSLVAIALTAIAVNVGAFVTGAAYASFATETAGQISVNAAPAMVALESASSELRELQRTLGDALHGVPANQAARRVRIERALAAVDFDVQQYAALPRFPGEARLVDELTEEVGELKAVSEQIAGGEPDSASQVEASASAIDATLREATRLNAAHLDGLGTEMGRLHHRVLPAFVALNFVSLATASACLLAALSLSKRAASLEAEARRSVEARARELETFSGRVAHDLLSPLMTVSLALGVAGERLSDEGDERARKMVCTATRSLSSVRALVDGLLTFARAGAKPLPNARVDVASLIDEVVGGFGPLAQQAGVSLAMEVTTRKCARCCRGVFTSLVSNLVQNAIKYTQGSDPCRVLVRALDNEGVVVVQVQDSGPGVPRELQGDVFEPYARFGERSGLGLGLATVKRLAEAHGGSVGFRSTLGRGSTFWFTLPAVDGAPAQTP